MFAALFIFVSAGVGIIIGEKTDDPKRSSTELHSGITVTISMQERKGGRESRLSGTIHNRTTADIELDNSVQKAFFVLEPVPPRIAGLSIPTGYAGNFPVIALVIQKQKQKRTSIILRANSSIDFHVDLDSIVWRALESSYIDPRSQRIYVFPGEYRLVLNFSLDRYDPAYDVSRPAPPPPKVYSSDPIVVRL